MPVSATQILSATSFSERSCRSTDIVTFPSSVNLSAFPTRFTSTCLSRAGSPTTHSGISDAIRQLIPTFLSRARKENICCTSSMICAGRNSSDANSSLPASILEKSKISLRTPSRCLAEYPAIPRISACSGVSPVWDATSNMPRTPLRGVRIS